MAFDVTKAKRITAQIESGSNTIQDQIDAFVVEQRRLFSQIVALRRSHAGAGTNHRSALGDDVIDSVWKSVAIASLVLLDLVMSVK